MEFVNIRPLPDTVTLTFAVSAVNELLVNKKIFVFYVLILTVAFLFVFFFFDAADCLNFVSSMFSVSPNCPRSQPVRRRRFGFV
jgi:hypothetical protein